MVHHEIELHSMNEWTAKESPDSSLQLPHMGSEVLFSRPYHRNCDACSRAHRLFVGGKRCISFSLGLSLDLRPFALWDSLILLSGRKYHVVEQSSASTPATGPWSSEDVQLKLIQAARTFRVYSIYKRLQNSCSFWVSCIYWGYIGDNGQENGNYYKMVYIQGLYRD